MPSGTGKTETMLALLVAARPKRVLVVVPSDALRTQVANKFESLGVLQELGIVSNSALRPVVGQIQHGFTDAAVAKSFAQACNIMVTSVLGSEYVASRLICLNAGDPGLVKWYADHSFKSMSDVAPHRMYMKMSTARAALAQG